MKTLDEILDIVRPLCKETKQLLQPFPQVSEDDELRVELHTDPEQGHQFFILRSQRWVNWTCVPTAQPSMSGGTKVDATDISALSIAARWSGGRIIFEDTETRLKMTYLIARFAKQCESAQMQADFKTFGIIPPNAPTGYDEAPLMPHQSVASRCAQGSEGYALFKEQGTGKTAAAISIVDEEADKTQGVYHHLIICPKSVCTNWSVEYAKFCKHDHAVTVIKGGKVTRVKAMLEARVQSDVKISVCIISYDSAVLSKEQIKRFKWDKITCDESHYFKWYRTKRWKALESLRDSANSRLCLTGTPIVNSLFDLWTQLEWLGRGWSGFNSFEKFRSFYGVWRKQGSFDVLDGLQNVPFIQERLARCAFLVRKAEVLKDLPEKNYHIVDVEMTKEQAEVYSRVATEILIEVERELEDPKAMTVNNVLVKMLRLAQITSGYVVYDQEYDPETLEPIGDRIIDRFDPNPKLEAVINIINDLPPTSKVLIWSKWRQDITTIASRLQREGLRYVTYTGSTKEDDRREAVRSFNEDENMRVFLGNPSAGGTGINLLGNASEEHACDTVIYFSQDWSAATRMQSEDRVHRKGTKRPVSYYDLCVPDSIDFQIIDRVTNKRKHALEIQDIRSILERLI